MQIILVRHAQPLIAPGVCYGALDVPVQTQANAVAAAALAGTLLVNARIHYSPLLRCAALADALRTLRPELHYQSNADLREMDFGQWEGQRWDAISPVQLKAWTDDFAHYHCGITGETAAQFVQRVRRALVVSLNKNLPRQTCVWITHAGVIRAIFWLQSQALLPLACPAYPDLPPLAELVARDWPQDALGFGQCWHLDWPN